MGQEGEREIIFMAERRFSEDEPVMVSIRCITYNHAPYIRQCLEGFVMQKTNFRFQAVVHDDASTDGTTEMVREYAEKYPDIIIPMFEEENRWSKHDGSLLTIMYPLLVGKYLAHCEGDDFWTEPYKLQKQVDFLEAHPDYVLTYTEFEAVDEKSNKLFINKFRKYSGDCQKNLILHGNFLSTPTTLYRREFDDEWPDFLKKLPFKPRMSDYVHWLYLSSKGKFQLLKDNSASYRVLQQSASHSKDYDKRKAFHDSYREIRLYFNRFYNVGIPENAIEKSYRYVLIRESSKYGRSFFLKELRDGLSVFPLLVFSPRVWLLFVIRVFLNKDF